MKQDFRVLNYDSVGRVLLESDICNKKKHIQQIAFSIHHKALTQVCFDCQSIRTNMEIDNENC